MAWADAFSLAGRVALVTGGNSGLGRAMALGLRDAGARVAVTGRNPAKNEAIMAELGADGAVFSLDVRDEEAVARTVNVLMVTPHLPPHQAANALLPHLLGQALVAEGHEVGYLTFGREPDRPGTAFVRRRLQRLRATRVPQAPQERANAAKSGVYGSPSGPSNTVPYWTW